MTTGAATTGGDCRRRVWWPVGGAGAAESAGAGDIARPAEPPPLPTAALSSGHRGVEPERHRAADPARAAQAGERRGPARRGGISRPRGQARAAARRSQRDLRPAHTGHRGHALILRPPRVGSVGAGPEDPRRCAGDPPPRAGGLRGRRARARPGAARRAGHFRRGGRRSDRRGDGRRARGDLAAGVAARLPPHRPGRRARASRRGRAAHPRCLCALVVGQRAAATGAPRLRTAVGQGGDRDWTERHLAR